MNLALLELILTIIKDIRTLTVNPALGGGGVGSSRAAELLHMLATFAEGGTVDDVKAFAADVKSILNSGGNPGRGQWEDMLARFAAVKAALDAAKAAKQPAATPTPVLTTQSTPTPATPTIKPKGSPPPHA